MSEPRIANLEKEVREMIARYKAFLALNNSELKKDPGHIDLYKLTLFLKKNNRYLRTQKDDVISLIINKGCRDCIFSESVC